MKITEQGFDKHSEAPKHMPIPDMHLPDGLAITDSIIRSPAREETELQKFENSWISLHYVISVGSIYYYLLLHLTCTLHFILGCIHVLIEFLLLKAVKLSVRYFGFV